MTTQTASCLIHPSQLMTENQRWPHWAVKARATAVLRQFGADLLGSQLQPVTGPVRVVYEFRFRDHRRRDVGNLMPSVKAFTDGITDAHIWPDDNGDWVIGPDLRQGPVSQDDVDRATAHRRVRVTVSLIEED